MKKIFYILLITHLTFGLTYSQSGWVKQNFNPNEELSSVFFVNENTGFIGACGNYSANIYKTTNTGLNWFTTIDSMGGDLWCVYFLNYNTGFAAYQGSILKTTNSGENWYVVYDGNFILFSIAFTSPDTGYACGKWNSMLKTTNGGDNWFTLTNTGGMHQNLFFVNNNTGFTVSEDDFVMKTTDGGASWIKKYMGYYSRLYGINFINESNGFCGGWTGQNMLIFKTINGGENWSQAVELPDGKINRITFVNGEIGYAVGSSIVKTTNAGQTWQIQCDMGLTFLNSIYFVNELTGYVCGIDYSMQKGVIYKTTTGGEPIGIQPISNEVPEKFILHQNYPNPFNPNTKIKFSIPPSKGARGMTSLIIYDILGREISVLVNAQLSPGVYEVEWDGTNYPSGVYFYQLKTEGYSETKKMVLVK